MTIQLQTIKIKKKTENVNIKANSKYYLINDIIHQEMTSFLEKQNMNKY